MRQVGPRLTRSSSSPSAVTDEPSAVCGGADPKPLPSFSRSVVSKKGDVARSSSRLHVNTTLLAPAVLTLYARVWMIGARFFLSETRPSSTHLSHPERPHFAFSLKTPPPRSFSPDAHACR